MLAQDVCLGNLIVNLNSQSSAVDSGYLALCICTF